MPAKGKKKGKGKGKGKKKKKLNGMGETPGDIVKRLYRIYLNNCDVKSTMFCQSLKTFMKNCLEDNKLIVKVRFKLTKMPKFGRYFFNLKFCKIVSLFPRFVVVIKLISDPVTGRYILLF